uniref:Neuropeptide-like protein 33 family protein n=1 Tax=Haemonchus contortus TaxID=6289 RepID=A0A7I5ECJ6_HAECO
MNHFFLLVVAILAFIATECSAQYGWYGYGSYPYYGGYYNRGYGNPLSRALSGAMRGAMIGAMMGRK